MAIDINHSRLLPIQILPIQTQMPLVTFRSTKGEPEIQEDIRQLCIADKEPDKYKDYLSGIHKKILERNGDKIWEVCILEAGIDKQTISIMRMNGRAAEILLKNITLANELCIAASPAILIKS